MSAADASAARPRPRAGAAIGALYSLLLRTQVTLPRLLGIGALGGLAVLLGVFARLGDNPTQAAADIAAAYGLGIVVPFAVLWFGTAAIGDLVEDRLLVYLWLKPVPRWQLPAAAILATITLVAPLAALPLGIAALVAGDSELALTALVAATLAGLWFKRAVWWGLAFVLLWENAAAYSSDGLARFTVTSWAHSILSTASGAGVPLDTRSVTAAFIVLPAVTVAGWLVATFRYGRADVD